jgi:signal transduction histidine kinase
VKQIVLNLLSNAIKFTPKGSITVRAKRLPERRGIAVSVTDTGIGISEADRGKIFEDFQQADNSPAREYGGVGLGLSICQRLARMLDGELTVKSRVGHGSTFTLVLPLRPGRR